jgi:hypothetical protein
MDKVTLEPMFESMDIEREQKVALQEAFDLAVIKKSTELMEEVVEKQVEEKVEVLKEEYDEKVLMLEDSLDGYLDTVVEEFIEENKPSYEAQIADEKAKTLLEMFDQMVKVVGMDLIEIQESKTERDQEVLEESELYQSEEKVTSLTEKVEDLNNRLIEARREADKYLKSGLINELKDDLSLLEGEKFEKLAGLIPFEKSSSYLQKLETLKESIISARADDFEMGTKELKLPGDAFKQPQVDVASATDFSKYV